MSEEKKVSPGQAQKTERVLGTNELALIENHSDLNAYPKTKAYIKACASYFAVNNNFIRKAITNRNTIENTLKYYDEFDIDLSVSKHYLFNKARPTPMQVIAMITGEKDGDLKKKYAEEMTVINSKVSSKENMEQQFNDITKSAFSKYSINPYRKELNYKQLSVLDEMMVSYINYQAYIIIYLKIGIVNNSKNYGLSTHFNHISAVKGEELNYLNNSLTLYFKSKMFINNVIEDNVVKDNIPKAFIDYVNLPAFTEEYDNNRTTETYDTFKSLFTNIDKMKKEDYFLNKNISLD